MDIAKILELIIAPVIHPCWVSERPDHQGGSLGLETPGVGYGATLLCFSQSTLPKLCWVFNPMNRTRDTPFWASLMSNALLLLVVVNALVDNF